MRYAPLFLILFGLFAPVQADNVEVDVELALMVDVSRSMEPWELELQRRGYAEALVSDQVIGVIQNGFIGKIAVTYVEWAGNGSQRIVVPWTIIDGKESADVVAQRLTQNFPIGLMHTSISGALRFAIEDIQANEFDGLRRVVDISGDGPNNAGGPVRRARDRAIEAGLVINGLPLMTWEERNLFGIPDLDVYYLNCVIGGPGGFVIPVNDWDDFPMAVRQKLVLELAGPTSALVTQRPAQDYNCMIGEQLRRQWQIP